MYPPVRRDHNKACNPREFVDMLEELIAIKGDIYEEEHLPLPDQKVIAAWDEEVELIKRALTDYLIAHHSGVGIAVQGEHR